MKLRKLAALAMTAVLSLTALAGCGNDDNKNEIKSGGKNAASSISEAFEKASALEKYTFSGSFIMNVSGDEFDDMDEDIKDVLGNGNGLTFAGAWEGKADTKNNEAEVSIGISPGGKSNIEMLDCVVDDGDIYIGVGTMIDGIDKLLADTMDNSIRDYMGDELPDGNYLKVSKETLEEIKEMLEETVSSAGNYGMNVSFGISDIMNSDEYKKIQEALEYFIDILVKGMKNGSDTCFTNDGSTYKMTINKKNINDILSGVLDEVEKNSDEVVKKINDIAGEKVLSSSDLEQTTALLKAYDVASLMEEEDLDFSFSLSASYVDDTFNVGIAFAFSEGTNKMAVSIENTVKKDDDLKISAPSDVISDEDAKPFIDEFMDSLRDGIDSTYDDDWYDDDWDDDDWTYDDDWDDDDWTYDDDWDDDDWNYDDTHHDDDHHNSSNLNNNSSNNTGNSSNKQYGSIKEYVEDPEFQAQVKQMMELYEGQGMSMTITGEGNKLIYTYKYIDEKLIDEDFTLEEAQAYFDEAIEEEKDSFISICAELPAYIDVKDPKVVLKYIDYDDTLIWEKEFSAED